MKKKGIATLALAGALAVSMMPAFAASNETTVGYTANGNASVDGDVMITVPKNVTFTDGAKTVSNFNVTAYVWNGGWVPVNSTNTLSKTITVKVASKNGYKLKTTGTYASKATTYTYTADNTPVTGEANVAVLIGTLSGDTGAIAGSLQMGNSINLPNDAGYVYFSDLLTYTFGGLDNTVTPSP